MGEFNLWHWIVVLGLLALLVPIWGYPLERDELNPNREGIPKVGKI